MTHRQRQDVDIAGLSGGVLWTNLSNSVYCVGSRRLDSGLRLQVLL